MKLHQSLKSLFSLIMFILLSFNAFADEASPKLVEVELLQDNLAPYKERREDHGAYVGLVYEPLELKNFVSALDSKDYPQLFGTEPLPLLGLKVDYKYNFFLGSLSLGLDFGKGRLSDSLSGVDRSLEVTKYGVGFKFTADMILNEPYLAPYVGFNVWEMELTEKTPTESFSETTKMGTSYTLGVLIQLDWLDFDTSKGSTFLWGLENTFIDLYATQYAKTSGAEDPNTSTDVLYGGGLRLEF